MAPRTSAATETVHISGDANVEQILTDVGDLASALPNASSSGFDPSQLQAASGVITDASIDVYSGVDDHLLRKLDANLTIDPSAIARRERRPGIATSRSRSRSRSPI